MSEDSRKVNPFARIIREYVSTRNVNIFLLMSLAILPASFCHAVYILLGVVPLRGKPHVLPFGLKFIFPFGGKYDFLVQFFLVFLILNLGLLSLKMMRLRFSSERTGRTQDLRRFTAPAIALLILGVLIYLVDHTSIILMVFAFFPILLALQRLTKSCNKKAILFIFCLFNMTLFIFYYRNFQLTVTINNHIDTILTFMANIGFSWLYVLPYNLFVFFPFIISVYFWNFTYPERYVSSFLSVALHENMVPVLVGLLMNVLLSTIPLLIVASQPLPSDFQPIPLGFIFGRLISEFNRVFVHRFEGFSTSETIMIAHLWIGSFILWFAPFFACLTQLEAKFETDFERRLRDIIKRMKDHIVVIGFGNLGKKVCSDLIERDVISMRHDLVEVFTPDLEIREICTRLLVVDKNDKLFDRVHMDPILQTVGVGTGQIRIISEKKFILIPAIVGDINSETTRERSQLANSQFVVSVPSDYEATFALSKFANTKDLNSVIAVKDSAQKDYFFPKMTAHDTFLIYPAFQEGMALGRMISASYLRLKEELGINNDINILIAGEGKQINYLIEIFWMEMERNNVTGSWTENSEEKKICKMPISIISDSRDLRTRTKIDHSYRYNKKGEIREITRRSARISNENIDDYLLVDLIFDSPYRLKTIEEIIREKKPRIVVVTSNRIQKVSKIFYNCIVAIERCISAENSNYKPLVVVGVLGDEYEEIQDILLYYTKIEPISQTRYPIQYLDAAFRTYDDSMEQIGGLAQSFSRKGFSKKGKRTGRIGDPFALYCCVEDVPGSLGNLLARLAGLEFVSVQENTKSRISLHFCRFQGCSGVKNYSFLADAELITEKMILGNEDSLFCVFQSESGNYDQKEFARNNIMDLLKGRNPNESEFLKILSACDRRLTCSVASYLRKVYNLYKNRDHYEYLESLEKIPKSVVEQELRRFFVNIAYHYPDEGRKIKNCDLPRATILVCCRHSEITGSLAAAVNNLNFKKVEEMCENKISDITYLRSYECYDQRFTLVEFYGNLIEIGQNEREILTEEGVIDLVFVNVITGKDAWQQYARDLCSSLNGIYGRNEYEVWADSASSSFNIAIIRKGFNTSENSQSVSLACKKRGCTVHDKIRLLGVRLV